MLSLLMFIILIILIFVYFSTIKYLFLVIAILLALLLIVFLVGKSLIFRPLDSNNIYNLTNEGINYHRFNKNSDVTLLVSHGNGGNIETLGNPFDELPYNVVTYDYLNYGASDKILGGIYMMNENHLIYSALSVFNDLKSKNLLTKTVIFVGISLGSFPATSLARRFDNDDSFKKGLILIVPFDKLSSVTPMGIYRPWGAFDNLENGKHLQQNTLLVRALNDKLMSNRLCENLNEEIENSEIFDVESDHNRWSCKQLNEKIYLFVEEQRK